MQYKSDSVETKYILVSFHCDSAAHWVDDPPSVVFRHRVPVTAPEVMYIYVGAPRKEIIGKCVIRSVERITIGKALKLAAKGRITKDALSEYIGDKKEVGLYHVNNIVIFNAPLSLESLRKKGRFFAPQSFLFLSDEGVAEIESMSAS